MRFVVVDVVVDWIEHVVIRLAEAEIIPGITLAQAGVIYNTGFPTNFQLSFATCKHCTSGQLP